MNKMKCVCGIGVETIKTDLELFDWVYRAKGDRCILLSKVQGRNTNYQSAIFSQR